MPVDMTKAEEVFHAACEIPAPQERAAYLDKACHGDTELRAEVEALLRVQVDAAEFLETPAIESRAILKTPIPTEGPGSTIGRYRLLEKIGEGGMAIVYMAEQQQPLRRMVAMKLIKLGMDSAQVIARFEAERQALALMDHPNIAKVLDAGATDTGRPFFVMELVRGTNITEFCDKNHLSTRRRLQLFVSVCEGVHHAHRKGIIHRDLKPSNILVTLHDGRPVAKIIDFGIAKAVQQRLTEKTLFTNYAQIMGTPEYMSPEQAELSGLDIDTRTDVYSLGVLLYELLVGSPPFSVQYLRGKAYAEIQQIIREEEPTTPSTKISTLGEASTDIARQRDTSPDGLCRQIRSELDWIVMKTLEKDRARRYDSASELAADVNRHLKNEPILAGPPSGWYRLKKLLQRNRTLVRTIVAIAIPVLVGLVIAGRMHSRIQVITSRADIERQRSLAQRLHSQGSYQTALEELEPFLRTKIVDAETRLLYAQILFDLGRTEEAEPHLEKLLSGDPQIAGVAHCLLSRIRTDPALARAHREQADRLLPATAEICVLRALATSSPDQAMSWLDRALELDTGSYAARDARAMLYYGRDDYANMQQDAEVMVSMRPLDYLGYALRGLARRQRGELARAVSDHNRALELCEIERQLPLLCDQRQRTYWLMGNTEAALQDARQCVQLASDEPRYRASLSKTLFCLGEYEQAQREFAQLDWQQHDWLVGMAQYVSDTVSAGQSLEIREDAIQSWPVLWIPPLDLMLPAMAELCETLHSRASRLVRGSTGFSSWSPDGRQLAYPRQEPCRWDETALQTVSSVGAPKGFGIEIIDIESGHKRVLVTTGEYPAWSPDGRHIAYVQAQDIFRSDVAIYLVSAKGGESQRLVSGNSPCWTSHDPTHLYFLSLQDKAVCYVDIQNPMAPREAVIPCPGAQMQVSPDGRYLAYTEYGNLVVEELASGKELVRWVVPDLAMCAEVRWSPDSREISLGISHYHFWPSGLWIYNLQRREGRHMLDLLAQSCNWSPDGSRVALDIASPLGEIWLAEIDPNRATWEALALGQTRGEYLRQNWHKHARYAAWREGYGGWALAKSMCAVGINQYQLNEYEEALWSLEQAVEVPSDPSVLCLMESTAYKAMTLAQLGRLEEAQKALGQARHLCAQGDISDETSLCQAEAIVASPTGPVRAAWVLLQESQWDAALAMIERIEANGLSPDITGSLSLQSARAALARAYCHLARTTRHEDGDLQRELACYEAAVRADPNHVPALCDLAFKLAICPDPSLRSPDRALFYAQRSCELTEYQDSDCLTALAAAHAENNDFAEAVKWQQSAINHLQENRSNQEMVARLSSYREERHQHVARIDPVVAWWPFDAGDTDNIADASGNQHNAIFVGDAHAAIDPDRGPVLALDGDGDWVVCEADTGFNVSRQVTLSVWFKISAFNKRHQAIFKSYSFGLRRDMSTHVLRFGCTDLDDPVLSGSGAVSVRQSVDDNRWHHVVGVYDGTRIYQYIDGQLDCSIQAAGRLAIGNEPLFIGTHAWPERPTEWNGWIDDVRIYNLALTRMEIEALCEDGR